MLFTDVGGTHVMCKQVCAPTCLGNLLWECQMKPDVVVSMSERQACGLDSTAFRMFKHLKRQKNVVTMLATISFISLKLITTLEIFLQVVKTYCESRHFSVWLEKLFWTCGLEPVKNRKISVPFPYQVFFSCPLRSIVTTMNKLL